MMSITESGDGSPAGKWLFDALGNGTSSAWQSSKTSEAEYTRLALCGGGKGQ